MAETSEDWLRRWVDGNTPFHQEAVNEQLVRHWPAVVEDANAAVLVPLCGKSLDMIWLRDRGHRVVGLELSAIAAADFFAENGMECTSESRGPFTVFAADGIEIWAGDFFEATSDLLGPLTAWYDRAAIVALPPSMRAEYAQQVSTLLGPKAAGFMLTFDYPAEEREGPPHSVSFADAQRAFSDAFDVTELDCLDLTEGNRWELSRVWKPVIGLRR